MWIKRRWLLLIGGGLSLPDIFRGIVWLLDWRGRIDIIEHQLADFGWVGVMISFLLNPPPWTVFIVLPIGMFFIYQGITHSRAFKLVPLHLIIVGLIIAACGVAWQYYKDFEIVHKAKLETVGATPTPPSPSLTEEDKQFRFGLRTFVLSDLQEQANNFGQLAGRLANTDSNTVFVKDRETTIAAGALLNTVLSATYYEPWNSLSKQANTTIELMDVPAVIEKMKSYFKAYADAQNDLWNFLVLAGLDPKQVHLLSRWIESDERATKVYNNLITSPIAGDLTHAGFRPASARFSDYLPKN